jgi:hypothetical protein
VDIALLKFCKQLHRFQFLICLHEKINALLALSLIQVLCESIDIGVAKLGARFEIRRAFKDRQHFFR